MSDNTKKIKQIIDDTPTYCKPDGEVILIFDKPNGTFGGFSIYTTEKYICCINSGKSKEFIFNALVSMLNEALTLQKGPSDFIPGFCRPREGTPVTFLWGKSGIGFGEIVFWINQGKLCIDSEGMPFTFIKDRFEQMVDEMELQQDIFEEQ